MKRRVGQVIDWNHDPNDGRLKAVTGPGLPPGDASSNGASYLYWPDTDPVKTVR